MYMLYILACILWEAGSNNYRSFLDNLMGTIVVFLCVRWSMTIINTMCSFYYSYSTCTVCITPCQRYTNGLQTGNLIIIICNSCKTLSGVHEIHGYLRSCNYFFGPRPSHTPLVDGNFPMKASVTRQQPTKCIKNIIPQEMIMYTHVHTLYLSGWYGNNMQDHVRRVTLWEVNVSY